METQTELFPINQKNRIFTPNQKLLALSWKQPFAELMLHGKIETRVWNTHYRGWVLICASQKGYSYSQVNGISGDHQLGRISRLIGFSGLERGTEGKAIAIGRLIDCRPMLPEDADNCFVQYYPDLFCHIYDNVQSIEPFPWKGSQGWKEVSEDIKRQINIILDRT
jgi:hypothetical protein